MLEKCYQTKLKTFVQVLNEEIKQLLDKTLWTFSQKAFIPHAMDSDPMMEKQPIYISTKDSCPMKRSILMLIGVYRLDIKEYDRVIVMVDGAEKSEIVKALNMLEEVKNLGHEVEYYCQNAKGAWEKK